MTSVPSQHSDEVIDQLFEKQNRALDPIARKAVVNELDRYMIKQAYSTPIIWWHRIVVHHKKVKGWHMTPSHVVGQDLTEVWIDADR